MYELALFAGAGGGILGGKLLGWRTVCAVERDLYAASVLAQRQNDGCLPPFPIWSDVSSFRFDNPTCAPIIDELRRLAPQLVISGGFPCQDISCAGKGAGLSGERSGLWSEFARIVGEIRPRHVFVENSTMLTSRGLGTVLGDLASIWYNARWCVLGAYDCGAPHKRERIWICGQLADSQRERFIKGWEANSKHDGCESLPDREQRMVQPNLNRRDSGGDCGQRRQVCDDEKRDTPQAQPKWDKRLTGTGTASIDDGGELGNSQRERLEGQRRNERGAERRQGQQAPWSDSVLIECRDGKHRPVKPGLCGMAHGLANRVDRIRAIGNGQVPIVAATAWRLLNNND